jgi:hypothetical protein
MSYKTDWLVPKFLILMKMEGEINVEVMMEVNKDFFRFIEEGDAPVHLLLDARGLNKINIQIRDIPKILTKQDNRFGLNYILTENSFARFIMNLAEHMTGSHYRVAKSTEEALVAILRHDSRLPHDLADKAKFVDEF